MTADLDAFRADVAAWLEESCPASMRTPVKSDDEDYWGGRRGTFPSDDARVWFERMVARHALPPSYIFA